MLFAYIPIFSKAETCISLKCIFYISAAVHRCSGGEEIRAPVRSGVPRAGTTGFYLQHQSAFNPMCNNPASTVLGLFPEQKLVCAMLFGGFFLFGFGFSVCVCG